MPVVALNKGKELKLRADITSALTHEEMDSNLSFLNGIGKRYLKNSNDNYLLIPIPSGNMTVFFNVEYYIKNDYCTTDSGSIIVSDDVVTSDLDNNDFFTSLYVDGDGRYLKVEHGVSALFEMAINIFIEPSVVG